MFKKTDPNPQLDILTAPSIQLGSRASKKYSDPHAWHNKFYSIVKTKIEEEIFKPLFPEGKKSGRPNASLRILVAMSVLKEGFGCCDEDLFEKFLAVTLNDADIEIYHSLVSKTQFFIT